MYPKGKIGAKKTGFNYLGVEWYMKLVLAGFSPLKTAYGILWLWCDGPESVKPVFPIPWLAMQKTNLSDHSWTCQRKNKNFKKKDVSFEVNENQRKMLVKVFTSISNGMIFSRNQMRNRAVKIKAFLSKHNICWHTQGHIYKQLGSSLLIFYWTFLLSFSNKKK